MIQLVRHPYDTAACMCLPLDPTRHRVLTGVRKEDPLPSWPWLRWCQKWTKGRLMVYRHAESGRFVLGAWAWAPWEATIPLVQELETFEGDPDCEWPTGLLPPSLMKDRLKPVHDEKDRMRRKIEARLKQEREDRAEDLVHRNEVSKFMRKCGLQAAATRLDNGTDPFMGRATQKRLGLGDAMLEGIKQMAARI